MPPKNNKSKHLSGNFVLRLTPEVHSALKKAAAGAQLSLNEFCKKILEENIHGSSGAGEFAPVVRRCHEFFQEKLVGVAVYGSWARGSATRESDIDVIAVVRADQDISRGLYRKWDDEAMALDPRIQVHFAHFPESKSLSSLWCEIAVDGIVLFDQDFSLSRHLIMVRHEILSGRVKRQISHGQPYWIFEDHVS